MVRPSILASLMILATSSCSAQAPDSHTAPKAADAAATPIAPAPIAPAPTPTPAAATPTPTPVAVVPTATPVVVPASQAAPLVPVAPASRVGAVPGVAGIDFGGLRFEKTREQLGTIDEGTTISAKFPFVNKSDRTITIKHMQATCGCTTGKLDKMVFAPGEGETITLNFNSTGKPGHQERILRVLTDDPEASEIPLAIVVDVRQATFFVPASVQFGDVYEGDAKSVSTEFYNTSGKPIRVLKTEVTGTLANTPGAPLVQVSEPEPWEDTARGLKGERSVVTLTIPREAQRGMVNGNVILTTDSTTRPTINLFFQGRVRGSVDIEPATIYFGIMTPNQKTERVATLSTPPGQVFTLTSYTLEPDTGVTAGKVAPPITVSLEAPQQAGYQVLRATIDSGTYDGHFQGKLMLTGKLGERDHSLSVPVTFFVRPMPTPRPTAPPIAQTPLPAPTAPPAPAP